MFASMSSRSRAIRTTQASSLGLRRPQRVIRQIAPSSRGVPLPARASLSLAGRRRSSLLHLPSSDGAPGVLPRPSQVSSRCRVNSPRLLRMMRFAEAHRCRFAHRVGISTGPGPPAVRASASAPIDFRRGDRSPVGINTICKSDRPGMWWRRLLGFNSRLRSASSAHVWPKTRSCPGFCLLQGCRALRRASAGLVPGYRSPASGTSTRRSSLTRDPSYPLMGLGDDPSHHV